MKSGPLPELRPESTCNAGDPGSIAGLGRPPGEGLGYPLWYSRASLVAQLVKNPQCGRPGFDPWVGKIPCRKERLPTPVFWPGEFHGLHSPWGRKESDTTERLSHFHFRPGFGEPGDGTDETDLCVGHVCPPRPHPPRPVALAQASPCHLLSPQAARLPRCSFSKNLKVPVAQSCPTLCNPTDGSLPGSSVHGIFQARVLQWVATTFSRGSS